MSLFFPEELNYVATRARESYRPLKWRGILPVESGVPSWAQFIEDRKTRSFVDSPAFISEQGPSGGLPEPSISVSRTTIGLYTFGYSYRYMDQEIEFAQKTGISLDTERVSALNLGAETFLESVAATGYSVAGVTMLGLGNLPDVSTATAANKAAGSDTPWNDATSVEIVADLHTLVDAVQINSKETQQADTIVMPLAQYQRANVVMSSALERTPLEIFRAQRPEISRILVWDRLKLSGAGDTPCAMAWDSKDPYGPKMLVTRELTFNQPRRIPFGWEVESHLKLGGVVCRNRVAVAKMSGL
jgi:hypothetical protein